MGIKTDIRELVVNTKVEELENTRYSADTKEFREEIVLLLDLAIMAGFRPDDTMRQVYAALKASTQKVDPQKCMDYVKAVQEDLRRK